MPLTLVGLVHRYGNDFAIPDGRPRSARSRRYYIPGMALTAYLSGISIATLVAVIRRCAAGSASGSSARSIWSIRKAA